MSQQKPICDVSKCDNNVFFMLTKARRILIHQGMEQQAEKLFNKFWSAGSREKMMEVLKEFVTVTEDSK